MSKLPVPGEKGWQVKGMVTREWRDTEIVAGPFFTDLECLLETGSYPEPFWGEIEYPVYLVDSGRGQGIRFAFFSMMRRKPDQRDNKAATDSFETILHSMRTMHERLPRETA